MNDDSRGLYRKYKIERTDGSSAPGGKHENCAYFVLDIQHDEFSEPALRAYAKACRERFPDLADDIEQTLSVSNETLQDVFRRKLRGPSAEVVRRKLGIETFKLASGSNELYLETDDALVGEIQFQASCSVTVRRVFHGTKNLLSSDSPIEAGTQAKLKFDPPEQFHLGLGTTFIVESAEDGSLIVSLWATKGFRYVDCDKCGMYRHGSSGCLCECHDSASSPDTNRNCL